MKDENVIVDKSFKFAVRILKFQKFLINENKEYVISNQLLKSGTSIGANIEEAVGAYSRKEFHAKITIAYKEARETYYWLRLLKEADIIDKNLIKSLIDDCEELLRIIGSIVKTLKQENNS